LIAITLFIGFGRLYWLSLYMHLTDHFAINNLQKSQTDRRQYHANSLSSAKTDVYTYTRCPATYIGALCFWLRYRCCIWVST